MKMQRDNLREERKVKLEQEEAFQRAKLEDQQVFPLLMCTFICKT